MACEYSWWAAYLATRTLMGTMTEHWTTANAPLTHTEIETMSYKNDFSSENPSRCYRIFESQMPTNTSSASHYSKRSCGDHVNCVQHVCLVWDLRGRCVTTIFVISFLLWISVAALPFRATVEELCCVSLHRECTLALCSFTQNTYGYGCMLFSFLFWYFCRLILKRASVFASIKKPNRMCVHTVGKTLDYEAKNKACWQNKKL